MARHAHVARQPIYDRRLEVVGYELLFRDQGGTAFDADPDAATSSVVLEILSTLGLERLVGSSRAHVNVTRAFLLEADVAAVPGARIVLEIPPDARVDTRLVHRLKTLKSQGFTVALDNFTDEPSRRPLLPLADLVKIDLLGADSRVVGAAMRMLAAHPCRLVASRIENYDVLEEARGLGFDFFQGHFFAMPKPVKDSEIPAAHVERLRVIARLEAPDVGFDQLREIISQDVGLSYRFLRYVNTAFFSLRRKVSSVQEALALLGEQSVKRWITLVVLAGIDGKPHELLVTALVRAKTCELLAATDDPREREALFTTGLFSVVDAMMDAPMRDVIAWLPFSGPLADGLVERTGPYGAVLGQVLAHERGERVPAGAAAGASAGRVGHAYLDAVAWANEAGRELR